MLRDPPTSKSRLGESEALKRFHPIVPPEILKIGLGTQWANQSAALRPIIPPEAFNLGAQWAKQLAAFRPAIPPDAFEPFRRMLGSLAEQLREWAPPYWDFEANWPRLSAIWIAAGANLFPGQDAELRDRLDAMHAEGLQAAGTRRAIEPPRS